MGTKTKRTLPLTFTALFAAVLVCCGWVQPTPADDGELQVNHSGPLPQDLSRLGGKILRIDKDGNAAAGNDISSGGDPRIYTYGHRNVQGIAFRPGTGRPFACEHGPGHDGRNSHCR